MTLDHEKVKQHKKSPFRTISEQQITIILYVLYTDIIKWL